MDNKSTSPTTKRGQQQKSLPKQGVFSHVRRANLLFDRRTKKKTPSSLYASASVSCAGASRGPRTITTKSNPTNHKSKKSKSANQNQPNTKETTHHKSTLSYDITLIVTSTVQHIAPAASALVAGAGGGEEDNRLVLSGNSRDETVELTVVHGHQRTPRAARSSLVQRATSRTGRLSSKRHTNQREHRKHAARGGGGGGGAVVELR